MTISAENDESDAPDKTFEVRGAAQGGRGVSDPAVRTLTITDDEDTPAVALKLDQVSISEDGGVTAVTASLDGLSSADVIVTVSATAVEPAVANDFRLSANRELTITAGQLESTGTVTVSAENNTMDGPNKTIEVAATVSGESGVADPATQILTIIDDEGAPTVTLKLASASISENNGETTVTATLSGTSSEAVTVTVSVTAEAPVAAGDFEQAGTTLTIGVGATESTGEVKITARDNTVDAPDKTVEVTGTVTGGNGATAPAPLTLRITDDEDTPTLILKLDPTSIPENNGETTVTASLDGLSSADVTVTVSAAAVEPAVANDFRLSANPELTITAGQLKSAGTVTISAENNDVDAPNKTVEVTASATGGNGVAAPAAQRLTITDDDGTPTLTLKLDPTSIGENGGRSTVTASLDRPSSESVTVAVSAAPVSPAVETDFTLAGTTLTIDRGQTQSTGTVTISAKNNDVDAPHKTLEVRGSVQGVSGVTDPEVQELTITDDEATPRVILDLSPSTIEEGGHSEVRATLSVPSSEVIKVNVDASSASPSSEQFSQFGRAGAALPILSRAVSVPGKGFVLSENRELTIGMGATASEGMVKITALEDGPNRTVEVTGTVTGGNGALPPMPKMLKIMDDDGAPAVTLLLTPARIGEDGGESTVTATLSPAASEPVTVRISASAVSPAVASDFALSPNRELAIAAGDTQSTGTVTITAMDVTVDNPDKQVTVTGTVNGPSGLVPPSAQTLTITDDDDDDGTVSVRAAVTVTLTLAPEEIAENGGESRVIAQLSGAADEDVTLTVLVEAVPPADANDFALSPNRELTIAVGETKSAGMVTLTAVDNTVANPNRQVTVTATVTGPSGLEAPAAETLTITDDEPTPTVTLVLAPEQVLENGGESRVTAQLSGATTEDVTLTVSASAVSPADSSDFALSANRELTIAAGETDSTGTVTVTAVDNAVDHPNRQVTVTATVTGPAGLEAPAARTLTITDDEGTPTVTLVLAPEQVLENGGESRVTAQLSGATTEDVTLTVSASAVSPADSSDFALSANRELTIAAGETDSTGTVTVSAVDNGVDHPDRQVTVTATVTGPAGLEAPAAETLAITDDEPTPTVTLMLAPEEVLENGGESRVTAQLSGATSEDVTLTVLAAAVSPADSSDFALSANRELTIAAGETDSTGTVTVSAVDNGVDHPDRQVTVTATVTGSAGLEAPDPRTLTIADDDERNRPPAFSQESYEFGLEEERDGRTTEVSLGSVQATDPEDEALTYALAGGEAGRFAVGSSNGAVSYIGPGEDAEAGLDDYALTVVARDPAGLEAEANVIVRIIPVNEMPSAVDDVAKTQEDEPVRVDVLANDSDPDGDRLGIVAVTAPLHGKTAVVPGGVRYTPAPDYHGPDAFSYTAADPGGLTATALVAVEVLPVNEPPEAEDDAAETQEDEPVVVDVLANDRDPDGDRLRVVDVTTPAHGSATMAPGGVRYAPPRDYHGADTFRYTVADPEGLTATATATLTVRPVNDAPEAVGAIPEQTLEEGGAPLTLDLTPYFVDVDGDVLTYAAESSDPAAATVTVAGTTLTLTAVVAGAARVTVTASDPAGLTATQVFGVAVGDRLVRAVLTDTLAALGRGHLSSVRQTVGRRLDVAGGETRRVMVAGQHFDPTAWHRLGPSGLMQTHALLTRAASLRQRIASMNLVGTPADPHLQPLDTTGAFSGFGLGLDQALQGTDVLLSFGGQPEEEAVGRQRRWTIWGQGDLQAFRGTPDTVRDYEGDLRTAYVGVDALAGRRWLFGAAVGRSGGRGTWQAGTTPGRLNTTLTTVYPYLRWGSGDTTVWAVAGAGRGTANLTRAAMDRNDASPLRLTLGLLEGRRRLATVGGGLRIGLRGEASAARLATGEGDDTIDALRAGVRRLRGGIEFTQELNGPRGMKLTPFGAVSARHDDGAGQTGVGLEVAGGMRLRGGRLQVEAQGRRLVLHSATGYADHGLSLAASVGAGAYQPGLTLTVRPTWGTAGVGANTLWQDHFQLPSQGIGFDAAGIDAQIGYGLPLAGGKLLEPFGGYGQRAGLGRRLQFGARLGALDQIPGLFGGPVQLEFTGERYDRPGNPSDHRFSMVGVVNFGAPRAKRRAVPRATTESRTAWPLRAADAAPLPRPAPPAPRLLVDDPGAGESAAPAPVEDFLQEPVEPAVATGFDGVPDPLPASPADVVNAQVEPVTTIDAAEAADPLPRLEPEPATLQEAAPRRAAAASNRTRPAARTDYQPSWPTDAVATDAGPEGDPLVGRVAPSTLLGYVTIIAGVLLWAIWRFLILARRERKRTPAARNPAAKMARASQRTRESAR